MSEELKSDLEDLPNRQNLVDTAVSFLLNPNVRLRPDDAKIAFLKKKGLSDFEIAEAFSKVKNHVETAVSSAENNQLVNAYPLPPYQTPSSWFLLKSYSSTFVGFAVTLYVLHRFYKLYIEPWLFGSQPEKSKISVLEEQLIELNNNITQLTSSVASLEEVVKDKMQEVDKFSSYNAESVPRAIKDVKDELGSVKSLMLNRFSFPGAPKLPIAASNSEDKKQNEDSKTPPKVVTIPKWQLRDTEPVKSSDTVTDAKMEESEGKEKSEPASLESNLITTEVKTQDQENNLRTTDIKIENKNSEANSDNTKCAGSRILNEDTKTALENLEMNFEEVIQNGNSKSELSDSYESKDSDLIKDTNGIEAHDNLSDSGFPDQLNVSNGGNEH